MAGLEVYLRTADIGDGSPGWVRDGVVITPPVDPPPPTEYSTALPADLPATFA